MSYPYPYQNVKDPLALPAGMLRHEISIQQQSSTQDAFGQPLVSWSSIYTCLAAILTMSAKEVFQVSQFVSQITHRITLRWPGELGIEAGQRVVFGKRVFLIQALDNVQERNRVLHLMCLELNGVQ
jgi:SPP1 family predicted phage head-tail adaptor